MQRKKVILDVDTGSDDAVALMLALLSDELDILGITVTWGNRPVENCADNTLRVVELLGKNTPVYMGCPAPMVKGLLPGRLANNPGGGVSIFEEGVEYTIHPEHLPIPAPKGNVQQAHACTFLIDTILNSPEKITLIPVGPPTNIGMAFRMCPAIVNNIEEVVFMGGAVDMGNVTPVAEANIFHDPEAAKIVLDSGVKTKFITLNATHSAQLTMAEAQELNALGTKAGEFAARLINIRADASRRMGWSTGETEPIHDALAVAAVLDETVITDWRRQKCNIDISGGFADGQLIVEHRNENNLTVNSFVSYKADKEKYFSMLKAAFSKGPKI